MMHNALPHPPFGQTTATAEEPLQYQGKRVQNSLLFTQHAGTARTVPRRWRSFWAQCIGLRTLQNHAPAIGGQMAAMQQVALGRGRGGGGAAMKG